ncbi:MULTISPECIES: hypothetical protein [Holzapfeliella]|uniref:Antitoxin n=2 Tax=Holzapfeliella TaxID=2767883 RepID=A0A0R2DV66_9LACO|nr:hypothetical protein [Holzapfeliella floricola]KRN04109.1 hypothetical protein FC86_GL000481 [Holzapfeliella floricola DSM 23037 = JCM 16512]
MAFNFDEMKDKVSKGIDSVKNSDAVDKAKKATDDVHKKVSDGLNEAGKKVDEFRGKKD